MVQTTSITRPQTPKRKRAVFNYQPPHLDKAEKRLRVHLVFPHSDIRNCFDDDLRVRMAVSYVQEVINTKRRDSEEIIVLPAGFHTSDLKTLKKRVANAMRTFRGHKILISAGADCPDKSQYSYLMDLANYEWQFVKKFRTEDNPGNRDDPRAYHFGGQKVFPLCCMDGCAFRGGTYPDSMKWERDLYNVVIDNAHFHGSKEYGKKEWGVFNAGQITAGLGQLAESQNTLRTKGLAVISFYTDRSPFDTGVKWYYLKWGKNRITSKDYEAGSGQYKTWYRVLEIQT
ncbi:MAG: hypothetical protein RDU59_00760 [Thermodesulfobacteriota bacterium]|nr:hypothetical protein [Thermodesulfobacteriota bacterium]